MSFRRFLYYCTLVGAWAALLGWFLARTLAPTTRSVPPRALDDMLPAAVYGLFLGLTVTFGLSLVDALWNFSPSQFVAIFLRVLTAMLVGLLGASACGGLAGFAFSWSQLSAVFIVGWVALGFLLGSSVSALARVPGWPPKDVAGPLRKSSRSVSGGTPGAAAAARSPGPLRFPVGWLLGDPTGNDLWSPTAYGFVALGGLIGLLVGFSQVILREAWIRVEAGFRPGRDLLITRDRTLIGRAEGSEIALFG